MVRKIGQHNKIIIKIKIINLILIKKLRKKKVKDHSNNNSKNNNKTMEKFRIVI